MEYDYEHEDDYAPRILWGRVALLVLGLLLAGVVGYCTAPDGASESDLQEERARVMELSSEVAQLRQQLDAQRANQGQRQGQRKGQGGGQQATEDGTESEQAGDDQDEVSGEGQTYVVQEGDTLVGIAEQFYGDAGKFEIIADANNLTQDTPLQAGQELVIPPEE